MPAAGRFRLTFVQDDAGGCIAFRAIEHGVRGDTLTVTAFRNAPTICPGMYTPVPFTIEVAGLNAKRYWLRLYLEGRWERVGQKRTKAVPWLSMSAPLR